MLQSLLQTFINMLDTIMIGRLGSVEIAAVGAEYLRVVSFSYIVTAISIAYTLAFRETEHVKLPFVATGVSLVLNAVFNYIFIFILGWGVAGAGAATVISRLTEMFILIFFSYARKYELCSRLKELFSFDLSFVVRFVKIALPVIINESFWGLGTSVNNAIFAHACTDSITAYNIVNLP